MESKEEFTLVKLLKIILKDFSIDILTLKDLSEESKVKQIIQIM